MRYSEIPGFPGYVVSSHGEVFSNKTNFGFRAEFRRMRPSIDAKGYPGLTLSRDGVIRKKIRVHRLVAELFVPNPKNLPCVRHLDGVPGNVRAENLAWGTYSDNENDKRAHGTYEARRNGKLSAQHRAKIAELTADGVPQKEIAEMFNVSRPTVTRFLNGTTWGAI